MEGNFLSGLAAKKQVIDADRTGGQMSPEAAGMFATDLAKAGLANQRAAEVAARQRDMVKQQMQTDFVNGKVSLPDIAKSGVMSEEEIGSLARLAAGIGSN